MAARRDQDIPIRPRYGILEANNDMDDSNDIQQRPSRSVPKGGDGKNRKNSTSNSTTTDHQVSSSYSEIPFLAQYPGAVPDHPHHHHHHTHNQRHPHHELQNDAVTPTEEDEEADNYYTRGDVSQNDSLEEDENDSDDNDSKDSSCETNKTPKRPNSLHCDSSFPYELEGATSNDGEMRHFVANNLEETLRTASPQQKRLASIDQYSNNSHSSTPSTTAGAFGGATGTASLMTRHFLQQQQMAMPQIDANVLNDIEIEAQYLAASVDNLTENLCNLLHSISSITADNVEVHKNAVNKLTDSMDANIKCMYTIMAKTEEISKSMRPTEQLGQRIREIKRLVDMLENAM